MDRRPNSDLSLEEKVAKRELKRLLKHQNTRRKLEVRLQQAIIRKDDEWIKKTRQQLDEYLKNQAKEAAAKDDTKLEGNNDVSNNLISCANPKILYSNTMTPEERAARTMVDCIYHELIRRLLLVLPLIQKNDPLVLQNHINDSCLNKIYWNQQCRILTHNMTKGTQTESMFQDTAALLGYTRTKFMERLVVHSLSRLVQLGKNTNNNKIKINK
jgi:hypothetical protein